MIDSKKCLNGLEHITKSELKQGCRWMLNLAIIYWKNHEKRYPKKINDTNCK